MMEEKLIATAKEIYLKTGNPGFILSNIYEILVKKGEVEPIEEQDNELLDQVNERLHYQYAKKGTIGLKELAHLRQSASFEKIVIEECKKQAVANYFKLQDEIDNF